MSEEKPPVNPSENTENGSNFNIEQNKPLSSSDKIRIWLIDFRDPALVALAITLLVALVSNGDVIQRFFSEQVILGLLVIFIVVTLATRLSLRGFNKPTELSAPKPKVKPEDRKFPVQVNPDKLYQSAVSDVREKIEWYQNNRQPKRKWSRWLRGLAIVSGSLGALAPVIASVLGQQQVFIISMGYVFLALAGVCIAGDRLYGHSSGWIRYIQTEFTLEQLLTKFQYDWLQLPPSADDTAKLAKIKLIQEFHEKVEAERKRETDDWAKEFQSNLADLEKTINTQTETVRSALQAEIEKAKQEKADLQVKFDAAAKALEEKNKLGVIVVRVKNGRDFDQVNIVIEDRSGESWERDVTAELEREVAPGEYVVSARGIQGAKKSSPQIQTILVRPGSEKAIEFELKPV